MINRFKLIGDAIKQLIHVIQLKKQLNAAQDKVEPLVEENSVPDIKAYIQEFKKNPKSCKMTIYDADYGIPVYALDPNGSDTFFCPFYEEEYECVRYQCEYHKYHAEFLNLKKQYETARKTRKNTVKQIFSLRTR